MTITEKGKTLIAVVPVVVLIGLLALDIGIFGSDSILGASQVSLLFSAGICVWLGMWLYKTPWSKFEEAIKSNIGDVTTAIVILLLIGRCDEDYSPCCTATIYGSGSSILQNGDTLDVVRVNEGEIRYLYTIKEDERRVIAID